MSANEMIAFWLVPAPAERKYFESLIAELAARFGAPVFEPHVTLLGGDIDERVAADVLHQVEFAKPIELEVAGIEFSDKYTKTLFVQFRSSDRASTLSDALKAAAGTSSDYEFNPHLSLVYKDMPAGEKAAAAAEITLPFERVVFGGIKAIRAPSPIKTREDVEAWRTLGERRIDHAR